MKPGRDAMIAALEDFRQLQYSTQLVSLYESFLVGCWVTAQNLYTEPDITEPDITAINDAVSAIFGLLPEHPLGRIAPFRYGWRQVKDSGRKTVWNITTRGPKLATKIFKEGDRGSGDIRKGLLTNSASILGVELGNRPRPSWASLSCLVLNHHDFSPSADWNTAKSLMLKALALTDSDLDKISDDRDLGPPLLGPTEWNVYDLPDHLQPPSPVELQTTLSTSERTSRFKTDPTVVVDKRVENMLRRAVASHPCILLVGPPGTGKGTLIRWLISKIVMDPTKFGFDSRLNPNPVWRTPDESWSSFELVGGLVPNAAGELEWSHGLVINAVAERRWLILDETNRADMDKIMGPLLTWLSEQDVEVGRTRPHDGAPIILGWNNEKQCLIEDPSGLGEPTRFLAGRDWRLFGTYNPQDAQRVFRFGIALSRRFAVVPIPAIVPGQFEQLLSMRHSDLLEERVEAVAGLYSQHYDSSETLLGPAVFLRMADYIAASGAGSVLEDIVAEAYVINWGKYLVTYDDKTFDELGQRIQDTTILTDEQWTWIKAQRNLLS